MKVAMYLVLTVFLQISAFAHQKPLDHLRDLLRSAKDTSRVNLLLQLSNAYQGLNHTKTLEYASEALKLSRKHHFSKGEAYALSSIGLVYVNQGNHTLGLRYWNQSLERFNKLSDEVRASHLLNNIGALHSVLGKDEQALVYHQKAKILAESVAATREVAQALNYIGHLEVKGGQANQALTTFAKARSLALSLGETGELAEAYAGIAQAYGKLSDYEKAFHYHNLLLEVQDTLAQTGPVNKLSELTVPSVPVRQQAHISLALHEFDLQKINLHQQPMQKALLIGLVFLILATFVLFSFRTKEEANQLLQVKNAVIDAQKQELERQRTYLEQTYKSLVRTKKKLAQTEKMASFGQLTAGVAHEINNPINFVSAGIDSLRVNFSDIREVFTRYMALKPGADNTKQLQKLEKLKKELEVEELIEESAQLLNCVKNGATRTKEIVKSLKTFTRLEESSLQKADIHEGLDSTLVILSTQLKDHIKVQRNYGQVPKIDCHPGLLNQVFMNLLSNAAQSMEVGGTITITTFQEKEEVVIQIEDTGVGMSEEVQQQIFEPFFTTKAVGEGTGLGLSISHGIIEKHRGTILVDSQIGVGTQFTIRLPLTSPATDKKFVGV
ncbi:tetratricopeptide repeat-containing sensor histidine kinase [Sabulibacter ruber]|uniref:tetratricopeptide repeat-containing sensor histidine kinase n=1 Tax=Sabulibacter ruber TaxID=2811901 RepID=UPI001A963A4B|nr:ATP-binding protein [Sabulibacter ruber]